MKSSPIKSGTPWGINDIDDRTLEIASKAAHRAGTSLATWLSQTICEEAVKGGATVKLPMARDAVADRVSTPSPPLGLSSGKAVPLQHPTANHDPDAKRDFSHNAHYQDIDEWACSAVEGRLSGPERHPAELGEPRVSRRRSQLNRLVALKRQELNDRPTEAAQFTEPGGATESRVRVLRALLAEMTRADAISPMERTAAPSRTEAVVPNPEVVAPDLRDDAPADCATPGLRRLGDRLDTPESSLRSKTPSDPIAGALDGRLRERNSKIESGRASTLKEPLVSVIAVPSRDGRRPEEADPGFLKRIEIRLNQIAEAIESGAKAKLPEQTAAFSDLGAGLDDIKAHILNLSGRVDLIARHTTSTSSSDVIDRIMMSLRQELGQLHGTADAVNQATAQRLQVHAERIVSAVQANSQQHATAAETQFSRAAATLTDLNQDISSISEDLSTLLKHCRADFDSLGSDLAILRDQWSVLNSKFESNTTSAVRSSVSAMINHVMSAVEDKLHGRAPTELWLTTDLAPALTELRATVDASLDGVTELLRKTNPTRDEHNPLGDLAELSVAIDALPEIVEARISATLSHSLEMCVGHIVSAIKESEKDSRSIFPSTTLEEIRKSIEEIGPALVSHLDGVIGQFAKALDRLPRIQGTEEEEQPSRSGATSPDLTFTVSTLSNLVTELMHGTSADRSHRADIIEGIVAVGESISELRSTLSHNQDTHFNQQTDKIAQIANSLQELRGTASVISNRVGDLARTNATLASNQGDLRSCVGGLRGELTANRRSPRRNSSDSSLLVIEPKLNQISTTLETLLTTVHRTSSSAFDARGVKGSSMSPHRPVSESPFSKGNNEDQRLEANLDENRNASDEPANINTVTAPRDGPDGRVIGDALHFDLVQLLLAAERFEPDEASDIFSLKNDRAFQEEGLPIDDATPYIGWILQRIHIVDVSVTARFIEVWRNSKRRGVI